MAARGFSDIAFVQAINSVAVKLLDLPLVGALFRRGMVEIRYVGRRSGKTFSTPVNYRRSGNSVVIPVGMPAKKNWWRNFSGEGGKITFVGLDGRDRIGHAVATPNERGGVKVQVQLDD